MITQIDACKWAERELNGRLPIVVNVSVLAKMHIYDVEHSQRLEQMQVTNEEPD